MQDTEKKENILLEFFSAFGLIFLYAFKGLKFILIDVWVIIFKSLSFNVDNTYQKIRNIGQEEEELYERTKFQRVAKKKVYKYSDATMRKYAKMKEELTRDLQTAGAVRSRQANVYEITVRDLETNRIYKDTMAGFSKLDINSFLVNEGFEVYSIKTSKWINFIYKDSVVLGKRISNKSLIFFLTQLGTYIKAGITLSQAVKILAEQVHKDKREQRVLQSISYELNLGESFSNAMAKQGNYFPALLINMIKAAEATGTLKETLDDMSKYYTEVENTRKQMVSALTYPAIITVFSIAVLTFIIIYVVPQFNGIYAQSGVEVTGLTAFIINLSDFLQRNIIIIILIFALAMIFIYLAYQKIKAVRVPVQIIGMKLPVIKNVIIYKELSIFAKTFAALLRNNVYITDSMDILSKITQNEVYKAIMYKTINNIIKGEKISDAFKNHWAVPSVAYHMIVTGESTGQLAEMMQKVSDYYQEMHRNIVDQLKSFIEPIMIALLAVMVGTIIIAVIVPMFQLYNNIM